MSANPSHITSGVRSRRAHRDRSMNHAPQHLAQADRHIVDLKAHIGRQRILVNHARDTGQPSRMAESLLDALEGSLRIFEKHGELIVAQLQRQPAK
jgi:hypothetical protein